MFLIRNFVCSSDGSFEASEKVSQRLIFETKVIIMCIEIGVFVLYS